MAHDPIAAADLVILNDQNVADAGLTNLFDDAPVIRALHSVTASNGTVHKYRARTQNPVVGLRDINLGREVDSAVYENVTTVMKVLDATFRVDVAAAEAYVKGKDALMEKEAYAALREAFFLAETAFINGDSGASFPGLANAIPYKNSTGAVDAAGTTANTGSSVYLVRSDEAHVAFVWGNNGVISVGEESVVEAAGTGGTLPAYYVPICGWIGCQAGGGYPSMVRICNLTEDSGKGLTDDLLARAYAMFPASRPPTHILSGRRSVRQLQQSRTSYSPTGAPPPFPTEFEGVPFVVTDGISATEALIGNAP